MTNLSNLPHFKMWEIALPTPLRIDAPACSRSNAKQDLEILDLTIDKQIQIEEMICLPIYTYFVLAMICPTESTESLEARDLIWHYVKFCTNIPHLISAFYSKFHAFV